MTVRIDTRWCIQAAQCYAGLYTVAAYIFYSEPDETLLKKLAEPQTRRILREFGEGVPPMSIDPDTKTTAENLAEEYCALFLLPPRNISLYESVSRGGRSLWDETTEAVFRFYKNCGFAPDDPLNQPPDHISLELRFLAHLAEEENRMWREKSTEEALGLCRLEKQFLDEHPLLWVPQFAERVAARSRFPFHPFFARLAERTILTHSAHLKELLGAIKVCG